MTAYKKINGTVVDWVMDFKKQVFIQWYPSDWLNDTNIKTLKPEVKGFWIDLISQMSLFYPYGHCSKGSIALLRKNPIMPSLKNFSVENLVNQNSNRGVDIWLALSVIASVEDQLKVAVNLENDLHRYLSFSPEEIKHYIKVLDDEGITSRTESGILYSRRMHKDFHKRIVAFKNGKGGGNPLLKRRKEFRAEGESLPPLDSSIDGELVDSLVNQNSNLTSNPEVNLAVTYNYNPIIKGLIEDSKGLKEGGMGETIKGKKGEEWKIQEVLLKPWAELQRCKSIVGDITEADYQLWLEFLQQVYHTPGWTDLFNSPKFPNPMDFTHLVNNDGFTKVRWKKVIEKILSYGVSTNMNLYFRIRDYVGYLFKGGTKPDHSSAGSSDFSGQETWGG